MSRDEATGQFAPEPVEAFGLEGIERDQGFVPYVDENAVTEAEPETFATPQEAADDLASHTAESDIRTYSAIDDLPENVTLTIEQAADMTAEAREADEKQAALELAEQQRKEVDALRGEKPEAKAEKIGSDEEPISAKEGEIDPEIERALNNPRIKEALAAQVGEAETARQTHVAGLQAATEMVKASLLGQFPEVAQIAGLPPERQAAAITELMQREPGRAHALAQSLHGMQNLMQQRAQQEQISAERQRASFAAESARFEDGIKDVPKARRAAVEGEILEALKERSSNMQEVVSVLKASEASSTMMKLLWELGDTRAQLKAIRNAPKAVASRNAPAVIRPGTSNTTRSNSSSSQIAALSKQLDSATGDRAVEIATRLYKLETARG